MNRNSIFQDYCPYLNEIHSISVKYTEVSISSNVQSQYRKLNYSCNKDSNCTFKDKFEHCSVYKSAPENPR